MKETFQVRAVALNFSGIEMKKVTIVFSVVLMAVLSPSVFANKPLTFEERVKVQEAIERVYYSHRIWPKENPQPKPAFEKMVTKEQIEAKVTDYLKKCSALETFWQRPIIASQLQAEMDRMAKGTKDAATLNELFAALNNDPYLIAECLARPLLADRLIHNLYVFDTRFHQEAREKVEEAAKALTPENFASSTLGECSILKYQLENETEEEMRSEGYEETVKLSQDEWEKVYKKTPQEGAIFGPEESEQDFTITHTLLKTQTDMQLEVLTFKKKSFNEWWGEEAANVEQMKSLPEAASCAFLLPQPEPETDCVESWAPTSTGENCPSARYNHTAVWTGTEMIVWGGGDGSALNTGGCYNPSIDSWTATSTGSGCPSARLAHTATWTGAEMIVWGGWTGSSPYYNTGGRYNPSTDIWVATSTGTNCPTLTAQHTAVWTGSEMIVWNCGHGGRYNPKSDSWLPTSTGTNCPPNCISHIAAWTGTVMIIWGGGPNKNGGRYNPSTDSWLPVTTGTYPRGRYGGSAVWTGSKMIIWGGEDAEGSWPQTLLNTGGKYTPTSNNWTDTSTYANCPSGRAYHTAVWTEREMIVWGGQISRSSPYVTNTGGRYNPSTNTWLPTSTGTNCPSIRNYHTAVWTGEKMIIWGGSDSTGGIYFTPYSPSFSANNSATDIGGCADDSGVLVEWSNPSWGDGGSGTRTFDVLRNGSVIASGLSSSTLSYTDTTGVNGVSYSFQVRATNGCGSSTTTTGASAADFINPSPSISGDTTGCSTSGASLSTGSFTTYQWNFEGVAIPGATSQGHQAMESGNYSVTVTNAGGCSGTSAPQVVVILFYSLPPAISGASSACTGSSTTLSTDVYPSYQWSKDGMTIEGATSQALDVTQPGTYTVYVNVPAGSCSGTSDGHTVQFAPPPSTAPVITGASFNSCPSPTVTLQTTETFGTYQWYYNGTPIAGATGQSCTATLSGDYTVSAGAVPGCQLYSTAHSASISFCPPSEVSPKQAVYPSRISKDSGSSTGYYVYFQKIDGTTGYNIYEGTMGNWYSHAGQPGNLCNATVTDLGTGEMRAEINPGAGNHYYLVTAYSGAVEGPSGFNSYDVEIPPVSCSP
jgi:hypothetical protein